MHAQLTARAQQPSKYCLFWDMARHFVTTKIHLLRRMHSLKLMPALLATWDVTN